MANPTLSALERAVQADPDNAKLRHLLAAGYAQAGDAESAKTEFFHAITLDPNAHVARFQLGLLLLATGDSGAARRIWQPLETLPEEAALKHFKRGLEAMLRGNNQLCREEISRGIAHNSDNPPLNADMRRILADLPEEPAPVRTDFSLYGTTRH